MIFCSVYGIPLQSLTRMEKMGIEQKKKQVICIVVLLIGFFIMPLIVPESTDEITNSTDNNGKLLFFKYYILSVTIHFLFVYSSDGYKNEDSGLVRNNLIQPFGNPQSQFKVC